MNWELIQVKKDTTRPSNVYYGINWGYRADETIEKSLDTGDILFFNYQCDQCFTPEEVIICKKDKFLKKLKEDDPQNVAFCFRTPQRLLVVHSDLVGDIKIEPYHEFLNKPFLSTVKARQIIDPPSNIVQLSTRFVEDLQEQKQRMQDSGKDYFSTLLRSKIIKCLYFDKIAERTVPNFLFRSKIMSVDPFTVKTDFVKELNCQQPAMFHKAYQLSNSVMIRSVGQANIKR